MAENILQTIIQLRYGTYTQWMNSDVILKQGEAAICAFTRSNTIEDLSNSKPDYTPPAIGIKIGNGSDYFKNLPWVQAIAADVYKWAKAPIKPTYTAQEIQGLQAYVENLVSGDVEVNIAPRIYQIVEGTGDNENKYYLRYKENNEESNWIIDTSTYIDLTDLKKIVQWLGSSNLNNYNSLIERNAEQIRYFINNLNKTDAEVTHKFVTSVSEQSGIITVTRAQPTFNDITGSASVAQGGTGRDTLTEDNVLVGNGTNQVKLIPIADEMGNNNYLVPNRVIKQYIDNSVSGLTGAMHFIGEANVVIRPNSTVNPNISGYNFAEAQPGDVILYSSQEYVWNGAVWLLLGDEGSYAIKGSIRNSDIADDAEIVQSKIAGLSQTFNTKVDKVNGKSLTSNDFTDELKEKLDNIQDYAQQNVIEHILLNDVEINPTTIDNVPKTINLQIKEFDDNSQSKLNSIEANAQVNKIEKILYDGVELSPDSNKILTINSDPHNDHINKIESIFINNTEWVPNKNKEVRITLDQAALNLNVLEGAIVPNLQGGTSEVPQISKKLELARIAMTGNVKDLLQSNDEYITLYCGTSTEVI